jgi:hypothetical protein
MSYTRNQELHVAITQNKESLQQVTSDISCTNFYLEKFQDQVQQQFDAMDAKVMGEFSTLKSILGQLFKFP